VLQTTPGKKEESHREALFSLEKGRFNYFVGLEKEGGKKGKEKVFRPHYPAAGKPLTRQEKRGRKGNPGVGLSSLLSAATDKRTRREQEE